MVTGSVHNGLYRRLSKMAHGAGKKKRRYEMGDTAKKTQHKEKMEGTEG
jgi:hypothetical protein